MDQLAFRCTGGSHGKFGFRARVLGLIVPETCMKHIETLGFVAGNWDSKPNWNVAGITKLRRFT